MLKKRTLGYYAPVILHYDGYHWNDEGEDWFKYGPKEIEQMEWFDKMGLSKQDCYYDGSGDFGGIKWNNRRCDREFLLRAGEPFYEWLIQESCEFDRMLRELFSHGTADRATLLKLFWEGRYQRWIPYLWSQPGGDKIPEDKE